MTTANDILIRRLDPGTAGIAAALYSTPTRKVDRESMRSFLADPDVWFLAAFLNGRPVGYLYGHRLPRADAPRPRLVVFDFMVAPQYRRRGAGRALIRRIRDAMRESECRVWLLVDSRDADAVAFVTATGGVRPQGFGPMMTYPRGEG